MSFGKEDARCMTAMRESDANGLKQWLPHQKCENVSLIRDQIPKVAMWFIYDCDDSLMCITIISVLFSRRKGELKKEKRGWTTDRNSAKVTKGSETSARFPCEGRTLRLAARPQSCRPLSNADRPRLTGFQEQFGKTETPSTWQGEGGWKWASATGGPSRRELWIFTQRKPPCWPVALL